MSIFKLKIFPLLSILGIVTNLKSRIYESMKICLKINGSTFQFLTTLAVVKCCNNCNNKTNLQEIWPVLQKMGASNIENFLKFEHWRGNEDL